MYKIYGVTLKGSNEIRYIGQTCNKIERRRNQHFHYARTFRGKAKFHSWIRSVNYEVEFKVLHEYNTKEEADRKEIELIAYLPHLTNTLEGGQTYPVSYGSLNGNSKRVLQYSLKGDYIATFESMADAEKITGIKKGLISGCTLETRIKRAGDFIWRKWKENFPLKIEPYEMKHPVFGNEKPIFQFDSEGNFIKEHAFRTEAAAYIGVDRANILYALKNNNYASGYIWVYKKDFSDEKLNNILKRKPKCWTKKVKYDT